MPRPITAHIDLSALRHNYRLAAQHAPNTRLWAVIKANAYGHGLIRVAKALARVADGFAFIEAEDGLRLREAGIVQPLLLLSGGFDSDDLAQCVHARITPTLNHIGQLEALCALEKSYAAPHPLPVYLKFNTGMNRLGFQIEDIPQIRAHIASAEHFELAGLLTHFATADDPKTQSLEAQCARFESIYTHWPQARSIDVSMANSAAVLRYPNTHKHWARPGIMLYGASPFAETSAEALGLKPVMHLSSKIISTQTLQQGDRVGYAGSFIAEEAMRIGIVACGYGDGYPRHAPTGTPILVNGVRTRTLGRVSMDTLACDLSTLPEAGIGSTVTLWGDGLSVDEVAASAGTIAYELLCALAPRVPVLEMNDYGKV